MIFFDLEPISQIPEPYLLVAMAEFHALASGYFAIDDLALDQDGLTNWFIEQSDPDQRLDLREEPQHALRLAREQIETVIREMASKAAEDMEDHYPFNIGVAPGVILESKGKAEINEYGWCYLALQMFGLDQAGLATFGKEAEPEALRPRDVIRRNFFALFEVIAGIAVANKFVGIPVFFSDCRSSQMLLKRLGWASRMFGRGAAKGQQQLHPVQAQGNDGGIDVVVGKFSQAGLFSTALVGATVQQDDLRRKVVNSAVADRFLGYLVDHNEWRPAHRFLVHPAPYDDGTRYRCAEGDCGYLARETIIENLRPVGTDLPHAGHVNRYIVMLARLRLGGLADLHMQLEFNRLRLGPDVAPAA